MVEIREREVTVPSRRIIGRRDQDPRPIVLAASALPNSPIPAHSNSFSIKSNMNSVEEVDAVVAGEGVEEPRLKEGKCCAA